MKFTIAFLVIILIISVVKPATGWPIEGTAAVANQRAYDQILDTMEKLKKSDAEIWIDFLNFRHYTKYDIDTLVYKINELVQEVNRLKGLKHC